MGSHPVFNTTAIHNPSPAGYGGHYGETMAKFYA